MQEPKERLRQARERAGYASASDAARALGMPVSTYASHENGQNGLTPKSAERYARAFRVNPEWLLYGRGEIEPRPQEPREPSVTVPVIGTIGRDASGQIIPLARGRQQVVEVPLAASGRWEAVLVDGPEFLPAYRAGSLLLYRPVQHDLANLIHHECVIETVEGRRLVRILSPQSDSPGFWSLESEFDDAIEYQEVRWASPIRFVQVWGMKPTRISTESEQG